MPLQVMVAVEALGTLVTLERSIVCGPGSAVTWMGWVTPIQLLHLLHIGHVPTVVPRQSRQHPGLQVCGK